VLRNSKIDYIIFLSRHLFFPEQDELNMFLCPRLSVHLFSFIYAFKASNILLLFWQRESKIVENERISASLSLAPFAHVLALPRAATVLVVHPQ
jgi:hypothetical protein